MTSSGQCVKIGLFGPSAVGKSAITHRYIQGVFVEKYDPTIEDTYRKQIEYDGQSLLVEIGDTAGQEEYAMIRDRFIAESDGYIMVYSITAKNTFEAVIKLLRSIRRAREKDLPKPEDIPVLLVGNKLDLEQNREVSIVDAKAYATSEKIQMIETSAKMGVNIQEAFNTITSMILRYRNSQPTKKKRKDCVVL